MEGKEKGVLSWQYWVDLRFEGVWGNFSPLSPLQLALNPHQGLQLHVPAADSRLHLSEHTREEQTFPFSAPRRWKQDTACLDIGFLTALKQTDTN